MGAAFYYIFKKNVWVLLAVTVFFVTAKGFAVYMVAGNQRQDEVLEEWISQCAHMTEQELEAFLSDLGSSLLEKTTADSGKYLAFLKLSEYYNHVKDMNSYIQFGKNREGVLPNALPANYMELLDYYGDLREPEIIHAGILDDYFELQGYSMVVLMAALLAAVLWGKHYETGLYQYTVTTPRGRSYQRALRLSVFAISFFVLLLNEGFDFFYSGLWQRPQIWNASVQSYREFRYTQNNTGLGNCLLLIFISKAVTVFAVCVWTEMAALRKKSTKDTVTGAACGLLVFCFLSQGLKNTGYFSLVQIGLVDWKNVIAGSIQLGKSGLSSLEAGCMIACVMGIVVGAVRAILIGSLKLCRVNNFRKNG